MSAQKIVKALIAGLGGIMLLIYTVSILAIPPTILYILYLYFIKPKEGLKNQEPQYKKLY